MLHYSLDDLKLISNNLSILLKSSAYVFLLPIIMGLIYHEPTIFIYLYVLLALVVRVFANLLQFKSQAPVERRHAVVTIILFWIIFSLFASIPFIIEGLTFIDGLFESVSALSSTGFSMFESQSTLMYSTLFWRAILEWLSGIGIVVLAILGLFMTYSKFKIFAESEGHSEKMKSSIKKTVLIFVSIYIIISIIGIALLRISGLPLFDSMYYTFTSISSTGSDMTDAGLMGYNSIWPLIIILGLMLFGSMSFITHYRAFSKRSIIEYFKDKTIWVYTGIIIFFFLFVMLKFSKLIPFHTLFYLISSATGGVNLFGASIHQAFPDFFKAILIFLMFIGASTASTGGGIKIQRFVIIIKSVWWKVKSILLPKNSLFRREFNGDMITDTVVSDVMSFALIYGLFILLGTFIFVALGYGALDSLLEITSVQTNIGLSVGIIGPSISVIGKTTAIILMFVGRLEIIPVLVLFGFIFNIRPWRK